MTDRVELRLRGRMLEKFVGRAIREGIAFQTVERTGPGEMRLAASEKDAGRIMAMAEEYGMETCVIGAAGKPYVRERLRERGSLALGILMGVLLVVSFTSRIWRVEAVSLDGAADRDTLEAVQRSAQEWGARPGILRMHVDREQLAADLQAMWPEMTHVSVRLSGVFLRVEVASEERAPGVYDSSDVRDLFASRDAIVVYAEPLAGKAAVKAGDTVRRGQVLIKGEERIGDEEVRRIRALGKVIGRVWFSAECTLPTTETLRVRTGRRSVSSEIRLGRWAWMIARGEEYPCQETETEMLPVGGLFLPVRIVRTVRWEAEEIVSPLNREQLMAEGEAWALEMARAKLPDGAEESACWVDFTEKNGMIIARATIEAQMNIAADRSELTGVLNE
ncbi:MAG: sporulation protein YqfD [Clostridia bacterium]|nr:sporulation protein YqfD [Clostridia bacterium]